jgi:hypothetical protein
MGLALALPASAFAGTITIGGYTFFDDAFPDQLAASTGTWVNQDGAEVTGDDLLAAVGGPDTDTWAEGTVGGESVTVVFTPPVLANGPGADLYLFSYKPAEGDEFEMTVTVEMANKANTYNIEFIPNTDLGVAAINLTDFGDASSPIGIIQDLVDDGVEGQEGDWVALPSVQISLVINWATFGQPSLAAIGAMNTTGGTAPQQNDPVPEPATLALMGIGMVGLVVHRRYRAR